MATTQNLRFFMRKHPHVIFGVLLVICLLSAINFGAISISKQDWFNLISPNSPLIDTYVAWELSLPTEPNFFWEFRAPNSYYVLWEFRLPVSSYVLWELRLPRVLFAAIIGACLGLAGALTQGLFRNPLADPGLLGVTSGAACAAALSIVFFSWIAVPELLRSWILPISAFGGGVAVCFLLDRLSKWLTGGAITGLLLTGIALNALTGAVIGLSTYLANDEQLRSLTFWTLGSLASASWSLILFGLFMIILAIWRVRALLDAMNALALGEQTANHLGVNVQKLRNRVILMVALLSGFAVAWTGVIGFIGLISPHVVRLLIGANQRLVAPLSMWVGAILLVCADTAARTLAIPAEIPVGIFTSLLGAPFFMLLLLRSRKKLY